jgi:cytochrome bd-type quinol oxidase subunit 1
MLPGYASGMLALARAQFALTTSIHLLFGHAATLHLLTVGAAPLLPLLVLVQVSCWWLFRRREGLVYW